MSVPQWPAALRQLPRRHSWAGGPMDTRRRFTPERGDDIVRRSTTAEIMLYEGVVFPNLSGAQRAIFEAFYADDLRGGTVPFSWADPVTGQVWLWRPNGDGRLAYSFAARGADNHDLTLSLVRRPGRPWWQRHVPPFVSAVPALVLDFISDSYGVHGDRRSLDSLIDFTRGSAATRVTQAGLVELVGVNVPRIDHDPITGRSVGLLMEGASTNLCLRSESIENAAWAKITTAVTANAAVSPRGDSTADRLVVNTGVASGVGYVAQPFTVGAAVRVAVSCWLKADGARPAIFVAAQTAVPVTNGYASATLSSDGASIDNSAISGFVNAAFRIERFRDGWTRLIFEATTAAATATLIFRVGSGDAGTGSAGVLLWGGQVELADCASSYIATTTAAAARAKDDAVSHDAGFAEWAPLSEGTLATVVRPDYALISAGNFPLHGTFLGDGTVQNYIALRLLNDPVTPSSDARVVVAGAQIVDTDNVPLIPPVTGVLVRQAAAWGAATASYARDGLSRSAVSCPSLPALSKLYLLSQYNGVTLNVAHLQSLVVFDQRLPDANLAALTA